MGEDRADHLSAGWLSSGLPYRTKVAVRNQGCRTEYAQGDGRGRICCGNAICLVWMDTDSGDGVCHVDGCRAEWALTAAAGAVSGHQAAAYGAVRSGARPGAAGSDAQADHGRSGGVGSDAEHFTLNQALSAPFSNGLTAAPARARVAWVTDAEGRRDIWIAGREEAARQVTHTNADDGQDLDGIAWSADAEQIAWTRGTGAQGPEHPVANPAELPGPVKQNVEMVDLRANGVGGALRVIAEGHAPLFLRDGSALLFLRSGNIWIAELTPGMHGEGPRDAEKDAPGCVNSCLFAGPQVACDFRRMGGSSCSSRSEATTALSACMCLRRRNCGGWIRV